MLLLALLVLISWQVAVHGPLLDLDLHVRSLVHSTRLSLGGQLPPGATDAGLGHLRPAHPGPDGFWLDRLGRGLSDLGNTIPAIPVLLAAGALAAWRHRRTGLRRWWLPLPTAAVTALLIPALVIPAKNWFARPGPLGTPLHPGEWGWYPSGHTATSAIAYGTATLLLCRAFPGPALHRRLTALTALACLGVGWGLVWSDFHWLLDVLASWCLAGLLLWTLARATAPGGLLSPAGPASQVRPPADPDATPPLPGA
ncbi:hypothetical protein CFP65_2477 [Kitasatospora sp. MMS16-BH015]|uniref:phosphatase PAP2 family protein n=1 Tax=Kitasatospora sp. MMS16-BH015 TaxID=2018025 RepID=UPI000CA156FE|nr:phosphatase PAP2 family protein [Kitasatospora sp. MMS16-BH015]AUG77309.1 hypothetical protein CFP65_2477 [Kitasatospora sp. MMS16-BH015]